MRINKSKSLSSEAAELRRIAEERLCAKTDKLQLSRTKEATQRLVHELEVHQIELEMQNAELREARNELERSLEKYTDLYDFAPVSYFTLDRTGAVCAVNLSGAGLLSVERARLLGQRFNLFVAGQARPAFADFLEKVFMSSSREVCELKLQKEGNPPLFVQIEGLVASSGQECRIALIDITQRKQMEEKNKNLASFPQLNPNPVLEVDTSGTVTFSNPATQRILEKLGIAGEDANVFIPSDLNDILRSWDKKDDATHYREVCVNENIFGETLFLTSQFEVARIYAYDITERKKAEEALYSAHEKLDERVRARTEELVATVDNLRKETLERQRAVEALRESEQMFQQQSRLAAMGEMINNIAHQWRQPLNNVALLIQQMQLFYNSGSLSKDELDSCVDKAMDSINHMSQTIDDFRNFFKPDKEQVLFKVHDVVAKTVSLVEDSFKNQQIGIDFHISDNPALTGFPNEYSQVLLNILTNARDALQEKHHNGGKVMIRISMEGEKAVVTIADNAGGIPEEIMDRIFEPYFTTKGPNKGTGVGLFMSKTIIEKNMNGSLTVRNTSEGAEFRIEV